jgi:predicted RNase H-like HicB family nuclease
MTPAKAPRLRSRPKIPKPTDVPSSDPAQELTSLIGVSRLAMKSFFALIYRGPDGIYRVSVPDFPAVTAAGPTLDHARVNAEWALFAHIRCLLAKGQTIPDPSSLADPRHQGTQIMTLALIEVDEKTTMAPRMVQHGQRVSSSDS